MALHLQADLDNLVCNFHHAQLVAAGRQIPEGAMDETFEMLIDRGVIQAVRPMNSAAVNVHGNAIITWVADGVC